MLTHAQATWARELIAEGGHTIQDIHETTGVRRDLIGLMRAAHDLNRQRYLRCKVYRCQECGGTNNLTPCVKCEVSKATVPYPPSVDSGTTCRHPLTDIAALSRSLWEYDKQLANPESDAVADRARNAFGLAVELLVKEATRLEDWWSSGEYVTVSG